MHPQEQIEGCGTLTRNKNRLMNRAYLIPANFPWAFYTQPLISRDRLWLNNLVKGSEGQGEAVAIACKADTFKRENFLHIGQQRMG